MHALRTPRAILVIVQCVLLATLATGCGGNGQNPGMVKVINSSRHVPVPPPRRDVPIDPDLQAKAMKVITGLLEHNDPLTRVHAVEALRLSGAKGHEPQILARLDDPSPRVRAAAAMAAGELGIVEARDLLAELAGLEDDLVQIAARFALHRLGDARLSQELVDFAGSNHANVRAQTALVLGMLGEKSALPVLRPMQADPEAVVRLQAAEAMWRLGDERGLQALLGASYSRFADDRLIVIPAIAAPRDARVMEHLRAHLTDDYVEVQLVAARAMGMLGSDAGYTIATNEAGSADPRRRQLAAFALGAIGRPDSQDVLANLLVDPDTDVRLAGAAAIVQMTR